MHAHVCSMGTLGTSLATTSEQPHMRYAYRKPNAGIVCIRRRRISFYSFFRWCVFRSASNHLRTYLRSRDYCQIYNGYLLICAVLYPRSFSRCAYAICHIVGDLHTRVLKGRKRMRPFHSSKTNMTTKQNQRKQISRWCSICTNDCALLLGFSVQWLLIWRTSIYARHHSQWEWVFGSFRWI